MSISRLVQAPLAKKLNLFVVLYIVMVAVLLMLANLGMSTLSTARAYVGGEGQWSKAQKDAVFHLVRYSESYDEAEYQRFLQALEVPFGDRQARTELEKENPNYELVYQGFIQGNNHPDDVAGMATLFRRFHSVQFMADAIDVWDRGDDKIHELLLLGRAIHEEIAVNGADPERISSLLTEVDRVNRELHDLEDEFSSIFGAAARWLHSRFLIAIFLVAGVLLTASLFLCWRSLRRQQEAQEAILALNQQLELRVRERTAQLETANCRLQNEIVERKRADEQIRREMLRSRVLAQSATCFNSQLDLRAVLDKVCTETARAMDVALVTIRLYDAEQDAICLSATHGIPLEIQEQLRPLPYSFYDVHAEPCGAIAILEDIRTCSTQPNHELPNHKLYEAMDVRSVVSVHITHGEEFIGLLSIATVGESREFSQGDLALLQGLADQSALALTNARLFAEQAQAEAALRQAHADLELQVQERTAELAEANAALRADIQKRRRIEAALRASEQQFRASFDGALDAMLIAGDEGNVLDANPAACTLFNTDRKSMAGCFAGTFIGLDNYSNDAWSNFLTLGEQRGELKLDCNSRPMELEYSASTDFLPGRHLLVLRDVTERKRNEELLRQSQKVQSLGVLAGGIAHDFNNLLSAMLGQCSVARAKLAPSSPALNHIEKATLAARRAADLTQKMLAFSGDGSFQFGSLDLNALVRENMQLVDASIPKTIHLIDNLAGDLPAVEADAGQMQQVIMNLLLNAAEAMDGRSGTVTVGTRVRQVGPDDQELWQVTGEPLAAGRYVCLTVSDEGDGMDAETRSRIFDPFFTTKFTGRGLGLASVLGIVRGHNGGLHVQSELGRGTTFTVVFPALADAPAQDETNGQEVAPELQKQQVDTVLVVDDEEAIREALKDILELSGFNVLAAADGPAGIDLYRRHADVALVLLDLSMPGMSGEETYRALRRHDPNVRVLIASGYSADEVDRRLAGQEGVGFLQKPFGIDRLLEQISHHLDRAQN